jgi:hypothetical protein
VTPSQSGHHREATRAAASFVKSQCGGPPTASIPKTRDQPEEPNFRQPLPCGNNASTGISPIPPIRQTTRGPTNHRQRTPHLDAGATTGNARTKHLVNVRTGQSRPADSTSVVGSRRSEHEVALKKPSVWLPASDSYRVDLWSAQLVVRRSSLFAPWSTRGAEPPPTHSGVRGRVAHARPSQWRYAAVPDHR